MDRWTQFRDAIGRLSVRHKPRLEQWQRLLEPVFADLGAEENIHRAIWPMFITADAWCANGRVNEYRAKEELRRAVATIEFWQEKSQEKGGVTVEREVEHFPTGQAGVERAARFVADQDWMPSEIKERIVRSAVERKELAERQARLTEILDTL